MSEITDDIDRRIAAGAEVLDRLKPGWRERINLETLDLSAGARCVLGQLYGTYMGGTSTLLAMGELDYLDVNGGRLPEDLGFESPSGERGAYSRLTNRWRHFIKATRKAAKP